MKQEKRFDKVVVAYSGGLDTSVIVTWMLENVCNEVIAYTADVGQDEDLEAARQKALATGAKHAIVDDLRDDFVERFCVPCVMGHAVYEGRYLLGTAMARPVIAEGLIRAANEHGATAICHGATGKGNDQVRFEQNAFALNPDIAVVSPWREWAFKGRADLLAYAKERGIDVEASAEKPYSIDRNLFHTSYEGGVLEDPWALPPDDMFQRTRHVKDTPDDAQDIDVGFSAGRPVSIDGKLMSAREIVETLNALAGKHGVGRCDIVENRVVGMKSRGVYETPAGTVLHEALRGVESLTLDREQIRLLDDMAPRIAALVYEGTWFAPEREAIFAMVNEIQKHTTGVAKVRLEKGRAYVVARKAERSLYDDKLATFEDDEGAYLQADAEGFIRLRSLRLRTRAKVMRKR